MKIQNNLEKCGIGRVCSKQRRVQSENGGGERSEENKNKREQQGFLIRGEEAKVSQAIKEYWRNADQVRKVKLVG